MSRPNGGPPSCLLVVVSAGVDLEMVEWSCEAISECDPRDETAKKDFCALKSATAIAVTSGSGRTRPS